MADRAIERRRIADERLEDESGKRERQRLRKGHDDGADLRSGLGGLCLSRRRARRRAPARARRAGAVDRSVDRDQSARLSPARSRARRSGRGCPRRRRSPPSRPPPPRRYGATPETVVAGPGSQALIQALARLAPQGAVGVLGPTYGGHAEAFAAAARERRRGRTRSTPSPASTSRSSSIPTIPTAGSRGRADLLDLHERLDAARRRADRRRGLRRFRRRGREPRAGPARAGAVVLRSFGKTYRPRRACGSASPSPRRTSRGRFAPRSAPGRSAARRSRSAPRRSPISTGRAAMRARLGEEAARLDALLTGRPAGAFSAGRASSGSRPTPTRPSAFRRLLAAGILTRPFAGRARPAALRDSRATKRSWARLAAALARLTADDPSVHRPALPSPRPGGTSGCMPIRGPRVFTIPAGAPFLPTLAPRPPRRRLIDGLSRAPAARSRLPSATIYVPTQRAAAALAEALLDGERRRERSSAAHRAARRLRAGRRGDLLRSRSEDAPRARRAARGRRARPAATRWRGSSAPGARRCAARSAAPTPTAPRLRRPRAGRSSPRPPRRPMRWPATSRR